MSFNNVVGAAHKKLLQMTPRVAVEPYLGQWPSWMWASCRAAVTFIWHRTLADSGIMVTFMSSLFETNADASGG